jgi:hypothetical protein
MELCAIRQQQDLFDGKGKKPVADSLLSGKVKEKEKKPSRWQKTTEGWMKINMDGAFDSKTGDGGISVAIRKSMGDDPAHGVEICQEGKGC